MLPGVGSDRLLRDLYDAGYSNLIAFDYAPESVEHCRRMMGDRRVQLLVADARDLDFAKDTSVDAVLDKGTLDAVQLIGSGKEDRFENLVKAVDEMDRVLKPGGIFWSLSAICVGTLVDLIKEKKSNWKVLTDGESIYTTLEGYTSNNIDGSLLVYRKQYGRKTE